LLDVEAVDGIAKYVAIATFSQQPAGAYDRQRLWLTPAEVQARVAPARWLLDPIGHLTGWVRARYHQ
jgi:hypothetical protein